MRIDIPDGLVQDVVSAMELLAEGYRNDTGHAPDAIAALHITADELDNIAARILDQRDTLAERLRQLEAKEAEARADRDKWKRRAEAMLRVVGENQVGALVKLLDERGHGAVDRDLQDLLDKLRPVVCW